MLTVVNLLAHIVRVAVEFHKSSVWVATIYDNEYDVNDPQWDKELGGHSEAEGTKGTQRHKAL